VAAEAGGREDFASWRGERELSKEKALLTERRDS